MFYSTNMKEKTMGEESLAILQTYFEIKNVIVDPALLWYDKRFITKDFQKI